MTGLPVRNSQNHSVNSPLEGSTAVLPAEAREEETLWSITSEERMYFFCILSNRNRDIPTP